MPTFPIFPDCYMEVHSIILDLVPDRNPILLPTNEDQPRSHPPETEGINIMSTCDFFLIVILSDEGGIDINLMNLNLYLTVSNISLKSPFFLNFQFKYEYGHRAVYRSLLLFYLIK